MIHGYKKLKKEIHIVNILRQLRVLSAIAKKGMTKEAWNDKCFQKGLKFFDKAQDSDDDSSDSVD